MNLSITVAYDDTQIPDPITTGKVQMGHQIIASIAFDERCAQDEKVLKVLDATAKSVEVIVSSFEPLF